MSHKCVTVNSTINITTEVNIITFYIKKVLLPVLILFSYEKARSQFTSYMSFAYCVTTQFVHSSIC